jgi:hypothetical protein
LRLLTSPDFFWQTGVGNSPTLKVIQTNQGDGFMKPTALSPVVLAETQIPEGFEADTASAADTRRDRKVLLTSLLFTSSLVTFALTSLPQFISLPALATSPRFATPLVQPHKNQPDLKGLSITVSPAAGGETIHFSLSANSFSTAVTQVSFESSLKSGAVIQPGSAVQSDSKTVAIALPVSDGDHYTLQVVLQPSASVPIPNSQGTLAQKK